MDLTNLSNLKKGECYVCHRGYQVLISDPEYDNEHGWMYWPSCYMHAIRFKDYPRRLANVSFVLPVVDECISLSHFDLETS